MLLCFHFHMASYTFSPGELSLVNYTQKGAEALATVYREKEPQVWIISPNHSRGTAGASIVTQLLGPQPKGWHSLPRT